MLAPEATARAAWRDPAAWETLDAEDVSQAPIAIQISRPFFIDTPRHTRLHPRRTLVRYVGKRRERGIESKGKRG